LKSELLKYCKSDVDVLLKSCMRFRDMFMEETTVDPFERSLTIASACNLVFRKLFLKKNTIGIIPKNNYHPNDNQSVMAIKWLKWISESENINIRHKLNGGEVKIGKFKVDGLYHKTAYEFYGCYWHGCQTCMKDRYRMTANQFLTAQEAFEKTVARKHALTAKGYKVVEMWECQFKRMIEKSVDLKNFVKTTEIVEPLNPRNGAYFIKCYIFINVLL